MNKITLLQNTMKDLSINAFILPINDEFCLESPFEYNNRLMWLSEFTGSFGILIVTLGDVYLFTDSRYEVQAMKEVSSQFTLLDIGKESIFNFPKKIGLSSLHYDPKLFTQSFFKRFTCKMLPVEKNPVDLIWKRVVKQKSQIIEYPIEYSGLESIAKCRLVNKKLNSNAPYFFTNSESICWLSNLRGTDHKYTPLICCRAILYPDGLLKIFVHSEIEGDLKVEPHIQIFSTDVLQEHLLKESNINMDPDSVPRFYFELLSEKNILKCSDPVTLLKAVKNQIEIDNAVIAHKKDGRALSKFLEWLKQSDSCTEHDAEKQLLKFRQDESLFYSLSFPTISAFGPNAVMIHYRSSSVSNAEFKSGNLYLFDSGAQYINGTTDITRTVAIGTPTDEQKFHYTIVLKAHIALSNVVFPYGTTGRTLDSVARSHLWKYQLDYAHGTGHGVGSFLNVHEGPHSFGSEVVLQPGMILSNEPGLYFQDKYGIRLENLMYVKRVSPGFLAFHTLTLVPYDDSLIDWNLLTVEESQWLEDYADRIKKELHDPQC